MNKIYIILPLLLMVAFGFYFRSFYAGYKIEQANEAAAELAAEEAETARLKALEAEAAHQAEEKARIKREEDEERKRLAREKQMAEDKRVLDEIASIRKQTEERTAEKNELEIKLVELRRARQKAETNAFDLAREVELTRIARRNAELELQRGAAMMADRTEASALVEVPLFPTPLPEAKRRD